jgi:hypothetical protein
MDSTATIRSAFEATLAAFVSACPTIYRASASSMLLAFAAGDAPGYPLPPARGPGSIEMKP